MVFTISAFCQCPPDLYSLDAYYLYFRVATIETGALHLNPACIALYYTAGNVYTPAVEQSQALLVVNDRDMHTIHVHRVQNGDKDHHPHHLRANQC